MDQEGRIEALFGERRALVGMLHVGALPGTPRAGASVAQLAERAVSEAREYARAGFHGLALENMHDRPYLAREVGPEVVAALTAVALEVRRAVALPLGVQVLAGANRAALAIAHACGAAFVRVEGFVFAHVADEGLMSSDAGELLRYRRALGAEGVRVFADVKKKHAAHALTADVDLAETARGAEFFLADGVIVSGSATGREADPEELRAVHAAVSIPTLVGSGIGAHNLSRFALADAFIVGSWVKRDGLWTGPLEPGRLRDLVRAREALPRA